jgi:hypothetical protein
LLRELAAGVSLCGARRRRDRQSYAKATPFLVAIASFAGQGCHPPQQFIEGEL